MKYHKKLYTDDKSEKSEEATLMRAEDQIASEISEEATLMRAEDQITSELSEEATRTLMRLEESDNK